MLIFEKPSISVYPSIQSKYSKVSIHSKSHFDTYEKHLSFCSEIKKSYNEKLIEIENKLRNITDHEEFYIIDEEGNPIYHRAVEGDEIVFTEEEKNLSQGKVITHNHPSGCPISFADFHFTYFIGAKEIRAVTKDKRYSIKLPPKTTFEERIDKISNSHHIKRWIVYLDKKLTQQEANHKVWLWVAKDENLDYCASDWPE